MNLSVVIPAHNEEGCIEQTVREIHQKLTLNGIPHEIVAVNDHSTDKTGVILQKLSEEISELVCYTNVHDRGFGRAVRVGLEMYTGDCAAIMMADLSDSPEDLVRFYKTLTLGNYDCVFGSRFIKGARVTDYPKLKLWLNRAANTLVRWVLRIPYNDCTNAFKLYRRETVEGLKPFLAPHFNITLELPLKVIVRGYHYAVLPNSWKNRETGVSKLNIKEMGSRYFFILMYCLIEKYFSKGDFTKEKNLRSKISYQIK